MRSFVHNRHNRVFDSSATCCKYENIEGAPGLQHSCIKARTLSEMVGDDNSPDAYNYPFYHWNGLSVIMSVADSAWYKETTGNVKEQVNLICSKTSQTNFMWTWER